MKTYKAIVSIGISSFSKAMQNLFILSLNELGWSKIDGLAETWEVCMISESKDDARFVILNGIMQAKLESGALGTIKIVIAFDNGRPTYISLCE